MSREPIATELLTKHALSAIFTYGLVSHTYGDGPGEGGVLLVCIFGELRGQREWTVMIGNKW